MTMHQVRTIHINTICALENIHQSGQYIPEDDFCLINGNIIWFNLHIDILFSSHFYNHWKNYDFRPLLDSIKIVIICEVNFIALLLPICDALKIVLRYMMVSTMHIANLIYLCTF